jgi:hypothetical protein
MNRGGSFYFIPINKARSERRKNGWLAIERAYVRPANGAAGELRKEPSHGLPIQHIRDMPGTRLQ